MDNITSRKQHYYKVIVSVKAQGFADAIHFQDNAESRADRLYEEAMQIGNASHQYVSPKGIGMLADGRMAVMYGEALSDEALYMVAELY